MSGGTRTDRSGPIRGGRLPALIGTLAGDRVRGHVAPAAGLVAALALAARATLRVLHNLPFDPVAVPPAVWSLTAVGVPVVLGCALLAVAVATDATTVRVGLTFAGVFATLAALWNAATLPAVVAVVAGGAVAVVGTLGVPSTYRQGRRTAIGVGFLGAVAVSLASAVGLLGGGYAGPGALLALVALAAVGLLAESDPVALAAGALAAGAVVLASAANPYAAGSALLVGFGVVGVPPILVAVAWGTGTAAAVAGLRRGEYALAAGAGLLVVAGVPATFPRATAVLLGAVLVCLPADALGAGAEVSA